MAEKQHKLAAQLERITAKGKGDTEQARYLQDYLSGVSRERGGTRGEEYSNRSIIDDFSGNKKKKYRQAEEYRKHFLDTIDQETGAGGISNLRNMDFDTARYGLTSPEYFAYNQQLMDANPELYQQARPVSSGALGEAAMNFVPGVGWVKRGLESVTDKVMDIYESGKGGIEDIYEKIKESDFVEDLSGFKDISRPVANMGGNFLDAIPGDFLNIIPGISGHAQGGIVETMPDYFHDYSRGI
jgi:hypothetical protein